MYQVLKGDIITEMTDEETAVKYFHEEISGETILPNFILDSSLL